MYVNLLKDEKVRQFVGPDAAKTINDKEIIALISYLQRLGRDIKTEGLKAQK